MNFINIVTGDLSDYKTAILTGASDGHLLAPVEIPEAGSYFADISNKSAVDVIASYFQLFISEMSYKQWYDITDKALRAIGILTSDNEVNFTELFNTYAPSESLLHLDSGISGTVHDFYLAIQLETMRALTDDQPKTFLLADQDGKAAIALHALLKSTESAVLFVPSVNLKTSRLLEWQELASDERVRFMTAEGGYAGLMASLQNYGTDGPCFVVGECNVLSVIAAGALFAAAFAELKRKNILKDAMTLDVAMSRANLTLMTGIAYASAMGLPISKVVMADADDRKLYGFLKKGDCGIFYDKGDFIFPINLKRLLYEVTARDQDIMRKADRSFAEGLSFVLPEETLHILQNSVFVNFADERAVIKVLSDLYDSTDCLVDLALGSAYEVYQRYARRQKKGDVVIFVEENLPLHNVNTCCKALFGSKCANNDYETKINNLSVESGIAIPATLNYALQSEKESIE